MKCIKEIKLKKLFRFGSIALLLFFIVLSCQRELDNPWDELSDLDPAQWAPESLTIKNIAIHNNELQWSYGNLNIEGFKIDCKKGEEQWQIGLYSLPKESRNFNDSTAIPDPLGYQYRLYAFAGTNNSTEELGSVEMSFPGPTDLTLEQKSDNSFSLSWVDNTNGEQGFKIDRRIDSLWQNSIAIVPDNQTSYTDTIIFRSLNIEYRVYAYYENAVSEKITAGCLPTISTSLITNIEATSATAGGTIVWEGSSNVLMRGMCWSTDQNPDLNGEHTTVGSGSGSFVSELTSLEPNTQYFVLAYATNTAGTEYGEQRIFTTKVGEPPTVSTSPASNIGINTATSGGTVTSQGSAIVTMRGVCWSTGQNPDLNDEHTIDGSGTGSFVSSVTGLIPDTKYYIRAYATNTVGTAYGDNQEFVTLIDCPSTMTDDEGNAYSTVYIDRQCWMKENLNIGTRINGSEEMTDNSTIEKYCYDNNEANCNTYGGLYQWDEMMKYLAYEGARGICPSGWHLPTDDEWTILTDYLGGESVAGGKMKEAGTAHWDYPNSDATNSSGFTALPGSYRSGSGSFGGLGSYGRWWSSTKHSGTTAWNRRLGYDNGKVYRNGYSKTDGRSVRCLKD